MQHPAFSARFPIRNLASRSMKSATSASRKIRETDDQLRELYRIDAQPDPEQASRLATEALQNLAKFMNSRPIAGHTREAFQKFRAWRSRPGARPRLAIDSGCGCGQSTATLARLLPDADVVGVDKSIARLSRNAAFRVDAFRDVDNATLLRAELVDFWRLCLAERCLPDYHFLLYPNPYPKKSDIKRRWHGHPVFPVIVALGGRLELRTSWEGYLKEFRAAYEAIRHYSPKEPQIGDIEQLNLNLNLQQGRGAPLTNFEAKYVRVGHPIHGLVIDARDHASREPPLESRAWIG